MTPSGLSLFIAALLLQAPAVLAAQLDKDSCSNLKTEQVQLEQGGVRGSLGKGPQWAKANLAPEKLEQVRRLIEVDEQLLFRCGGRPLVILPSDPDPAARGEVEGGAKAPPGKGTPAKGAKTPAAVKPDATTKKKAVPQKKAAAPPVDAPVVKAVRQAPPSMPVPQPQAAPLAASAPALAPAAANGTPPAETASQPSAVPTPAPSADTAAPASATSTAPTPPAASAKEAEARKAAAIKAAKIKAKKKAADAYSPAAGDWTSNPFAGLLAPAPAKK